MDERQAIVDDQSGLYVQDDSPTGETRYRARFYFDPAAFDPGEASGNLRTRVFLAFAGQFVISEWSGGPLIQTLISLVGILIMVATASLLSWYKQVEGRHPSSRTKPPDADLAGGEA